MTELVRSFVGIAVTDMGMQDVFAERMAFYRQNPALTNMRWTPPHFLHLTLSFMGEQPVSALLMLQDLLRDALVNVSAFPLQVERCCSFPDARSRILAALSRSDAALLDVRRRVTNAVSAAGIAIEHRPYLPHITLGRMGKDSVPGTLDDAFVVTGQVVAVSLYRSELQASGSHYSVIARWVLAGL